MNNADHIEPDANVDEQLVAHWLDALTSLETEADCTVSDAFRQRVKAGIAAERAQTRRRRLRFPALAASVAAAAVVVLLVVPFLYAQFKRPAADTVSVAPPSQRYEEAAEAETTAAAHGKAAPKLAGQAPAAAAAPTEVDMAAQAAPEAWSENAPTEAQPAPRTFDMAAPETATDTLSVTHKDGTALLLTRGDAAADGGTAVRERFAPADWRAARRYVRRLLAADRTAAWQFMEEAFAAGDDVLVLAE